jgi:hypothetical protein
LKQTRVNRRVDLRAPFDDDSDLAALKVRFITREHDELTESPAIHSLMGLRHLTRHCSSSSRAEFRHEIGKHLRDAMRRFEEHERTRLARELRELRPALTVPRRKKPLEAEPARRQAGNRQCRSDRRGPGNRAHIVPCARRLTNQLKARVGEQWSSRIAHQRQCLASLQPRQ